MLCWFRSAFTSIKSRKRCCCKNILLQLDRSIVLVVFQTKVARQDSSKMYASVRTQLADKMMSMP
eukprot:9044950-Prorocentrum_lima.AAC.1